MKNKILISLVCIFAVLSIFAAVYFIPQQKQVDLTFHGMKIKADGTVIQECIIDLQAVKQDYLFQDDAYRNMRISVDGYELDRNNQPTDYSTISVGPYLAEYFSFLYFIGTQHYPVSLVLDSSHKWFIVTISGYSAEPDYYIGTLDSEIDPMEIYHALGRGYFH